MGDKIWPDTPREITHGWLWCSVVSRCHSHLQRMPLGLEPAPHQPQPATERTPDHHRHYVCQSNASYPSQSALSETASAHQRADQSPHRLDSLPACRAPSVFGMPHHCTVLAGPCCRYPQGTGSSGRGGSPQQERPGLGMNIIGYIQSRDRFLFGVMESSGR